MKRLWVLLLLAAALLGASPMQAHDPAELLPVQAVTVRRENGRILLACDQNVTGSGPDLASALTDLRPRAPGIVYLETAEHIVLLSGAWDLAGQTASCGAFRPAAKLYLGQGNLPDAKTLADYLSAHTGQLTLSLLRAHVLRGERVLPPRLTAEEGGLRLVP